MSLTMRLLCQGPHMVLVLGNLLAEILIVTDLACIKILAVLDAFIGIGFRVHFCIAKHAKDHWCLAADLFQVSLPGKKILFATFCGMKYSFVIPNQ